MAETALGSKPRTQEIEAEVLTKNSGHDADQVDELVEQVGAPIDAFYGDGAYDQWKVYDCLAAEAIQAIIPPRKNAKIKQHGNSGVMPLERDEAIRGIRSVGRKQWKKEVGYHRRSLRGNRHVSYEMLFRGDLEKQETWKSKNRITREM